MFFLIILGITLALLAPALYKFSKRLALVMFSFYPLLFLIYLLILLPQIIKGDPEVEFYNWVPVLQINISFYADGLSILFAIMITFIGFLVMLFSSEYMKNDKHAGRFYLFILLFMASMLGLVLAGNIICLFIFWEITSISSFFLIGHKHQDEDSRKSALQALLVTAGGGLLLLAGMIILGERIGTYELSEMLNNSQFIRTDGAYVPILLLVSIGAFTKSAQFPFHFWLPNAMAAPTPVSAYLHSATMVKVGIYLLARLSPVLGETVLWSNLLMNIGAITMLTGAIMAVLQTDMKKILAYSTVSSLGMLVLLIGIGGEVAIKAAMSFLIIHSLYKGALFLVVGNVDYLTTSRDISKLGGLFKYMPLVGLAGIFAALSYSGVPPLIGFIGKELIYEAAIAVGEQSSYFFIGLAVLSNILLVVTAIQVGIKPFMGKTSAPKLPLNVPFLLWFGPAVLALAGLFAGVFPQVVANVFITQSVSAILNVKTQVQLELWHGLNVMLFLSVLTVTLGVGLYFLRLYRLKKNPYLNILFNIGPEKWYEQLINALLKFSWLQTKAIQNGYLRHYLLAIILFLLLLLVITLFMYISPPIEFYLKDLMIYEFFLGITIVIASISIVITKSRLMAVASLGLAGYGLALIFVLFGAPDIAMTQFTIDTLTVILFVLILYKLPTFSTMSTIYVRIRDMLIALTTGALLTFIIFYVSAKPSDAGLRTFFAQNSYLLAKGRNVVNVILVDFRSLDTLVEITVLAVAAIGVYALLKLKLDEKQ
ncbi:MAG: putative monovalent cation/H+ antiporter subunit A [Bacteroidetes bacterium]|nr:putative monovalent cation/H+ antiporter subunit A [Bacteroidota bacterium]HET6244492.1 putative monovalent cation/H+ antiporter subunit A [Bacteroidia bacterium]